MRVLAIDHGEKRLGLAMGDTAYGVALPRGSISADDLSALEKIIIKEKIEKIIVGLPLTLRGEEGAQAQEALLFGESLESKFKVPVAFFDERLTTKAALGAEDKDAGASAILLNDWFSAQKSDLK